MSDSIPCVCSIVRSNAPDCQSGNRGFKSRQARMYHCTSCNRKIDLPDYTMDGKVRICPEVDCGKKTIVASWEN